MRSHGLAAHGIARPIAVDSCAPCNLFWFDSGESVGLTPQSVIDLFRYIGSVAAAPRTTHASAFVCPRCGRPLVHTHDLQRTTSFTYWRCPRDGGQLMSFHQFLRAKNFIRTPSPVELAKLRETVRQIACSQCGAPIDLATDSACAHCGTPIALIDPDGVAKALAALTQQAQPPPADDASLRAALAAAQADALIAYERARETHDRHRDLVAIGVAAVAGWLAERMTAP